MSSRPAMGNFYIGRKRTHSMRGAFATFGRVILLSYFDLFEVIFVRHIFLHGRSPVYFLY